MSESNEHRKIKEIISNKLKEWFGCSIQEYPSSGHRLDVYAVTPDGISIAVEVIWSSSRANFYRDLNLVQGINADIKIVIANPNIIENDEFTRAFSKVAVEERKKGTIINGELFDGRKVLTDSEYINKIFKKEIFSYIEIARGYKIRPPITLKPPPIPKADEVQEILVSNLFPVREYPAKIYSSPTDVRLEREVFSVLGEEVANYPFILKEKKFYTFLNLSSPNNPFLPIINRNQIYEESTSEWIKSEEKRRDLIRLLNLSLRIHCTKRLKWLSYDKKHKRFIFQLKNGKENVFRWRAGERFADRCVAKPYIDKRSGKISFCRHYAAKINFMFLNGDLFLKIEPTVVFTRDGVNPLRSEKVAYYLSRWLAKQYNEQYLRLVRLWAKYLSRREVTITINVGEQRIIIDTIPVRAKTNFGIKEEDKPPFG